MKRLIQLFLALGLVMSIQSCTQDGGGDNPDNLTAPSIPPTSLFTIPTQSFGAIGDKESTTRNDKSSWVHAGINVLIWNSVVFTHTSIPIAAFGHSFEYEAVYIGDLTWEWKYEYQEPAENGNKKFDISLTGELINDMKEVAWTMNVKEQGSEIGFIWYDGIVARDHSLGNFTVYKTPSNPEAYMKIEFSKNASSDDVAIKFSNVTAGDEGFGDYIEWKTDNGSNFDRIYDVYTNNNLLEIQSNETSKSGRVKDPKHFGDAEWHCWDTNKVNIEC